jgi:hypothetical protein
MRFGYLSVSHSVAATLRTFWRSEGSLRPTKLGGNDASHSGRSPPMSCAIAALAVVTNGAWMRSSSPIAHQYISSPEQVDNTGHSVSENTM